MVMLIFRALACLKIYVRLTRHFNIYTTVVDSPLNKFKNDFKG